MSSKAGQDYWLTGAYFTVADINLVVFMERMTLLRLEDRFFGKPNRPLLYIYHQRAHARKSVKMRRKEMQKMVTFALWSGLKRIIPYVIGTAVVGTAFGLGYTFMKNRS